MTLGAVLVPESRGPAHTNRRVLPRCRVVRAQLVIEMRALVEAVLVGELRYPAKVLTPLGVVAHADLDLLGA